MLEIFTIKCTYSYNFRNIRKFISFIIEKIFCHCPHESHPNLLKVTSKQFTLIAWKKILITIVLDINETLNPRNLENQEQCG